VEDPGGDPWSLIVAPLAVNTIVTNNETKPAKADGGRIIDLQGATFR
jgi:hypothetical protein